MSGEAHTAICVDGLVKRYGTRTAVDGLSFEVRRGEIFALLGPNGAGKTTTIEILEGFRRPDGGTVQVDGLDPVRDGPALRGRIGMMLQEGGLYPAITPVEALRLFSGFYPRPRDTRELLSAVGLDDAAGTRYRRLSGGQKQRLRLALALLPSPDLVFLDEPTAGMDPGARRSTWEIVKDLRAAGTTVMLTTHYLDEAEYLANRVAIMDGGRLLALDAPAALVQRNVSTVRMKLAEELPDDRLETVTLARPARRVADNEFVFETEDAPGLLVELTRAMHGAGCAITELRVGYGSLEEVFLDLTGREIE